MKIREKEKLRKLVLYNARVFQMKIQENRIRKLADTSV